MDCVFCNIRDKKLSHGVIFEDDICMVFLDKHPLNPGHLLIIPKAHETDFWKLEESVFEHIASIGHRFSKILYKEYSPKKVAFVISGFDVPHVHVHLTPLHSDQDMMSKSTENLSEEQMEKIATHLKTNLV